MEEEAGFGLNCTANDVSIANATNITILDDGCAYPGDTVTFKADFEVLLTAEYRHDVGLWFAADGDPNGDGARTGSCTAATPAYAPDPPWLDLDGTNDPLPKDNKPSGIQDTCGDINVGDVNRPVHRYGRQRQAGAAELHKLAPAGRQRPVHHPKGCCARCAVKVQVRPRL
jgi:hypothetical protein